MPQPRICRELDAKMKKKVSSKNNILIIGDTHEPFTHKNYLQFCKETQRKYKCKTVVHVGDLVDNHAISYHEHDPDGWSPAEEMKIADKKLKKWFKAFPNVKMCRGNHDRIVDRKGKTVGLPKRCFKAFREIWQLPKGWEDDFEFEINGVLFKHGSGSGQYSHVKAAIEASQSVVIGHTHFTAGVEWIVTSKDRKFGMAVGCGIDRKAYAFEYGRDFRKKPVLSCGVVLDNGQNALVEPMKL